MSQSDRPVEATRKDMEYWLGRKSECQQALNVIQSTKGENTESALKLKGKLEAYEEMISYCQRQVNQ
jgi:hypothetical protein